MAFWSEVHAKTRTISKPITIDKTMMMAAGRSIRKMLLHSGAADCCSASTLLDIPQSAESLLDQFFRRGTTLVRSEDLLHFFFQHVDYEFVHRLISRGIDALLHLVEQFAFNLDLV